MTVISRDPTHFPIQLGFGHPDPHPAGLVPDAPLETACLDPAGRITPSPDPQPRLPPMKLANLITTDRILPEMKAADQASAIVELVDHLVARGLLPLAHRDMMVDALLAREDQVSTGIGSGVAIPHAFSDDLDEVVAVFGRSRTGIDFEAIDQAPVHLIILFIVPRKDYHLHLRTLAAIAKMFTNSDVRRRLNGAATREEMVDILHGKPARPSGTVA